MSSQYLRRASLIVAAGSEGLDLSELRIRFKISQADTSTPNTLTARVYNMSTATALSVRDEYQRVILQAGYRDGNYGVIFDGTIKQVRRGRESATDTYLDILAADGDAGLNHAILNVSLAAGSSPADRLKAVQDVLAPYGVKGGYVPPLSGSKLPRGKALFGMARDELKVLTASEGMSYSIQKGELVLLPLDGFKPSEAVVISAQTGMIGWPEQTENGIKVRCLLNPLLEIGCKLQIDNASIIEALQNASLKGQLDYANLQASVPLSDDGVYRIYVIEHSGDTRGQEWYSDIVCLSIDGTVPMGLSGKGQG